MSISPHGKQKRPARETRPETAPTGGRRRSALERRLHHWLRWGPPVLIALAVLATWPSGATRQVAVLIPGDVEFFRVELAAMRAEADRRGIALLVFNARWDVARQQQQLSYAATARFPVIALCAVDTRGMAHAPSVTARAGTRLMTFTNSLSSRVDPRVEGVAGHVGRDEYVAGTILARATIEAASTGRHRVGLVEGACGTTPQALRTAGFLDELHSEEADAEVIWRHCVPGWSTERLLAFLETAPQPDVVATQWADAAVAVAHHYAARDTRPSLVTLESNPAARALLRSGELSALTEFGIAEEGRATIRVVDMLLHGQTPPAITEIQQHIVRPR